MNYNADEVFKGAAAVASMGWKVVKLWCVRDNATCTCHKGAECASPGKHPQGENWPERATNDEEVISSWFSYGDTNQNMRVNIGVKLGADSGLVDIEVDGPEAEEALRSHGLHLIDTPTYSAGRGNHRLFRWQSDLPDVAVLYVGKLEVRLGGGGKAAQSVIPCSWHRTGVQYQWLPGKSPEDIPPAALPPEFCEVLRGKSRAGVSGAAAAAIAAAKERKMVEAGGRHQHLVGFAAGIGLKLRTITEQERPLFVSLVHGANLRDCSPPKGSEEVTRIANDQFDWLLMQQAARNVRNAIRPYERCGLYWNDMTSEWDPGNWKLTVVYSDPVEYRIRFPYDGRTVSVSLDCSQFLSARDVASAILAASGKLSVNDPSPSKWSEIWIGRSIRNDDEVRDIRGLSAKLLEECDEENPSVDTKVSSHHAAMLKAYLNGFQQLDDEEDPHQDGTPKWLKDKATGKWVLWVKWNEMISSAWRQAREGAPSVKAKQTLRAKILEITGEKEFPDRKRVVNGKAGRWMLWTDAHLSALDQLTGA